MKSLHKFILTIVLLTTLPITAWSIQYPFQDNMNTMDNWTSEKNWGLSSIYHSANRSITDSPNGGYNNSESDNELILAESFSLSGNVQFPRLVFWHKYEIESEFDYGYVDISKDNGVNWQNLDEYTGISDWTRVQINLSDYVGYTQLKLRFSLESDKTVNGDGWYIDDVSIGEAPHSVMDFKASPSTSEANAIELTWIQSYDDNFASYQIYRADATGVKISDEFVKAVTNQSQTSYRDVNLDPNATYYYKIYVFTTLGITTGSRETVATTLSASPITLTVVAADQNMVHLSWNECTNNKFDRYEIRRHTSTVHTNSQLIQTITDPSVISFMDDYTAIQPTKYRYKIWVYFNDISYANESNEVIAVYDMIQAQQYPFHASDTQTGQWNISGTWGLTSQNPHSGLSSWTDSPNGNYPDNAEMTLTTFIDLSQAFHPVLTFWHRYFFAGGDLLTLEYTTNDGQSWQPLKSKGGIDYKWQGVENTWNMKRIDLSAYSAKAQFGIRFRLKTDATANADGWYMDDLSIQEGEVMAEFPFTSDDEYSPFFYDATWTQSDNNPHSGLLSWEDSPFSSNYLNSLDSSLYLTIDLRDAIMPMLSFWHFYSFQTDKDYGGIIVQPHGQSTWDNIYFITGRSSEWKLDTLDLAEYAGRIITIRFQTTSNASITHEGWTIDQIQVTENTTRHSFPFHDNMDTEQTKDNWVSSSWDLVPRDGDKYVGSAWADSPAGIYRKGYNSSIALSGTIDLSESVNPQLIFWQKYIVYSGSSNCDGDTKADSHNTPIDEGVNDNEFDSIKIQLSDYHGHSGSWKSLKELRGSSQIWTKNAIDLSDFANSSFVRIRFVIADTFQSNTKANCDHRYDGWYIDNISIAEATEHIALTITNNTQNEVSLEWNVETVETVFSHYEIYRHTASISSRNANYLIKTISDKDITSWTDPIEQLQPKRYYYKIWIIDQGDGVNIASNEVITSYSIPTHSIPFIENGENSTTKWSVMTPFGLTDTYTHSGNYAWTDSPVGDYAPNSAKTMTAFFDLSQTIKPVLSFWHRYELQQNADYMHIYTSINNGASWVQLKNYTGNEPNWYQERLNLSDKAGKVVGIQFRLNSNASTEMDGWYMDDLIIQDEADTMTYPFSDDVETDALGWFYSASWQRTTEKAHSGEYAWSDSPYGTYGKNINKTLEMTVDLSQAMIPVLSFWHMHYLEENDYVYVELPTNKNVFQASGSSGTWKQEYISLSDYVGQKIKIVFRIDDNNDAVQSDGWYIDDIAITEAGNTVIAYPFSDSMDTLDHWFAASWYLNNEDFNSFITTDTTTAITNELFLAHTIDLRQSKHPQLSFKHKNDSGQLHISTSNGTPGTWSQLSSFSNHYTMWHQETIDLSQYAGYERVRIKFKPQCTDTSKCWQIDDIRIGEDTSIPAFIKKESGDQQKGEVDHALQEPFVVRVYDSDYLPKPGIPVVFEIVTQNAGSLEFTRVVTDAEGIAGVRYTNGSLAGEAEIIAYIENQPDEKVSFSAFSTVAKYAYAIQYHSGNFQMAETGQSLDNPLVIKVLDIRGDPVKDTPIHFTLKMGTANILNASTTSNYSGLAQSNVKMGDQPGKIEIKAIGDNLVGTPILFTIYSVLPGGYIGDMDGDAMPDEWEIAYGFDPKDPSDANLDNDNDLLTNAFEYIHATDPNQSDSDNDTMPDGWEVKYMLNPNDHTDAIKDNDGDGVSNADEYLAGSPPTGPPHFSVSGVTNNWMDIYGRVNIDGSPAEPGDEIAVIDYAGIVCGHYVLESAGQYGFMHVYKDNTNTPIIDEGMSQGEVLNFRIWDASNQTEINATPHVITGTQPPTWTNDGDIANIDLNGAGIKIIPLHEGWNLISFPIKRCFYVDSVPGYADGEPDIPLLPKTIVEKVQSIADVLTSIHGQYEVVRSFDQKGAHTYDPKLPDFNDMKYIAGGYGYWIKMKASANLEINGVRTNAKDRLALHKGWNLIGYWHRDVQYVNKRPEVAFPPDITSFIHTDSIKNIFYSIENKYDMIRSFDKNGAYTFDPMLDAFNFNDFYYAGQGYGFWIRMKEHGELFFE